MNDWAVTARTRQGLYRTFGEALLPPRAGLWMDLRAAADHMSTFPVESYAFFRTWDRFRGLVAEEEPPGLDAEYVKLFASGIDATLCPPTESFYRTKAKGGGIAQLLAQIQGEYREMGLASIDGREALDHVSTQLEIMSVLCQREFDARTAGDTQGAHASMHLQNRFLQRHLARWLPAFTSRVRRSGATKFYSVLAEATHAFVVHDADFVRAAVAQEAAHS